MSESDEDTFGPMPVPVQAATPPAAKKRRRVLDDEAVLLEALPCAAGYQRSFMHRDVVTHVIATSTDFVITASTDGHVKFWKRSLTEVLEFVKHFKAHLSPVADLAASTDGTVCATVSSDKMAKIFDVVNFDMMNQLELGYTPSCCSLSWRSGAHTQLMVIAPADSNDLKLYDITTGHLRDIGMHTSPVTALAYSAFLDCTISTDKQGVIEVFGGEKSDYDRPPKTVRWESKLDTDLYALVRAKTWSNSLTVSPNGKQLAILATDQKLRIFNLVTGKLTKELDESQQISQDLGSMELGRRLATERELEKVSARCSLTYDSSGHFLLFATMLGVKVVNLVTNRVSVLLGKEENVRFLRLALLQGVPRTAVSLDVVEGTATALPLLVATGYKKNRFYLFTRVEPAASTERDIYNEKPLKDEAALAARAEAAAAAGRLSEGATLHTTLGDIQITLFLNECPKTVENFCTHARNGYFNGHIFHRVIKSFMIQTGDPRGDGTGGESIWGGEFADEFHPALRHDKPFTLSMANAGPNSNGSQFFITLVPCTWLDNKHTVFGRVVKGMDVIQAIGNAKTDKKSDKPWEDIKIVNITMK